MFDLKRVSTFAVILLIVLISTSNCDDNKTINSQSASPQNLPDSVASDNKDVDEPTDDGQLLKKEFDEANSNKTGITFDNYQFYKPEYIKDPKRAMFYWTDFSKFANQPNSTISTRHEMLSKSHRRAAPAKLSFEFPFYGHPLRNIIIATGGFLYVGDHLHHWLAATQNISPLMANFDLNMTNYSDLHYHDNGTAFTVQWLDVQMKDNKPPGNFSFQTTLHKNGDIVFVYKHLPVPIKAIPEEDHPVKVGISDAFMIDNIAFFIRKKTIFDYHRLNMKESIDIGNETAIYLKALPTCNQFDSCEACSKTDPNMKCSWCPAVKRCSNGLDRKRQEWMKFGCQNFNTSECVVKTTLQDNVFSSQAPDTLFKLSTPSSSSSSVSDQQIHHDSVLSQAAQLAVQQERSGNRIQQASALQDQYKDSSRPFLFSFLVFFGLSCGLAMWVFHAYKNPHTPSGQLLIKYRPSNWRWQAPDNRYTAASIHM